MRPRHFLKYAGCVLLVAAAVGCGDDDGGSDEPAAPAGKALEALSAAELESLCAQLLSKVRAASTPQNLCTQVALAGDPSSVASCNAARTVCIEEEDYKDEDEYADARCADLTSLPASARPSYACDTTVSEVSKCYDSTATWFKTLSCSSSEAQQKPPECYTELQSGDCEFDLAGLLASSDGGMSTPDMDAEVPGTESVCRVGGKSYPYDFGDDGCNACATSNCCDSYAACRNDESCACFWDCLGTKDDCYTPCGLEIDENPPQFDDHALCLIDSCDVVCGLN